MKRWLGGAVAALAGAAWLCTTWLAKQALEDGGGQVFKASLDRYGPAGRGIAFLACGLVLLLLVTDDMAQENRLRVAGGRKPRYDWLEFGIVLVGGLVFGMVGLAELLGWG